MSEKNTTILRELVVTCFDWMMSSLLMPLLRVVWLVLLIIGNLFCFFFLLKEKNEERENRNFERKEKRERERKSSQKLTKKN